MSVVSKMMRIAGRNPDGIAKAINTDKKGNVVTTDLGIDIQYPFKSWQEITTKGDAGEINLLDIKQPIVIDMLSYFTNDMYTYARVTPYDKNGNIVSSLRIGDVATNSTGIISLTPRSIVDHNVGLAEIMVYNVNTSQYKIMYRNLKFPHGARVDLHRTFGDTSTRISANAIVRLF